MIGGYRTPDGALFVINDPGNDPTDSFVGGLCFAANGALRVTDQLPIQAFVNGLGVRNSGHLCIRYGFNLANAKYAMGLPFDFSGHLCCQLNQPVSPGDAYVGGIRVGPLGGVYVVDIAPVQITPWSSGFSEGFGNGP